MTSEIYLAKDDLELILQFMDSFDHRKVQLTVDTSSGIGTTIEAKLHGVVLNGSTVSVSKMILDESNW